MLEIFQHGRCCCTVHPLRRPLPVRLLTLQWRRWRFLSVLLMSSPLRMFSRTCEQTLHAAQPTCWGAITCRATSLAGLFLLDGRVHWKLSIQSSLNRAKYLYSILLSGVNGGSFTASLFSSILHLFFYLQLMHQRLFGRLDGKWHCFKNCKRLWWFSGEIIKYNPGCPVGATDL